MDYLGLNEFIERVSFGELGPGLPIEVRNMGGDRIHRISLWTNAMSCVKNTR